MDRGPEHYAERVNAAIQSETIDGPQTGKLCRHGPGCYNAICKALRDSENDFARPDMVLYAGTEDGLKRAFTRSAEGIQDPERTANRKAAYLYHIHDITVIQHNRICNKKGPAAAGPYMVILFCLSNDLLNFRQSLHAFRKRFRYS